MKKISKKDINSFHLRLHMESFVKNDDFKTWGIDNTVKVFDWFNLSELSNADRKKLFFCLEEESNITVTTFPIEEGNDKSVFTNINELIQYLDASSHFSALSGLIFSENMLLIFEIDLELLIVAHNENLNVTSSLGPSYTHEKYVEHIQNLRDKGFI